MSAIRLVSLSLALLPCVLARAEDWPTFRHDNRRSGATTERLDAARLREQWVWRSPHPPQPAWAGPAKWDAYHNLRGLRSMRNYDPVFHVIAVGGAVYLGSSVDDAVHCLDASTGKERWLFHTDGPVRLPPAFADGKLYFGSDDGSARCIRASDASVVWAFSPTPGTRRVLDNGRLISLWPVRTGVVVDGGTAYFGAALLPWKPSYLCAVDAATGKPEGQGRYVAKLDGVTMEGAVLASSRALVVPQGRVSPLLFDRATGKPQGGLKGGGGCMVVLTDDEQILHGPGNKTGWITASSTASRKQVANYPSGNAVVVAGKTAWLLTDRHLIALDRATRRARWRVACQCPHELILAGDVLFAGGDGRVAAFQAADGKRLWQHAVEGHAHGLAVASGALLVSTDEGAIHCFRPTGQGEPRPPAERKPAVAADTGPVIEPNEDKALVGRWVFHRSQVAEAKGTRFKALAGKRDGVVLGKPQIVPVGQVEALRLDGKSDSVLIAADHKQAALPTGAMTAEAWVRVDKPQEWGGIVGAVQDNGSYERGWLLGFRNAHFTFALAAKSGAGSLGYLNAKTPFKPGQWHHVVGAYDGAAKRIYVNGKLENTTTAQKGDILYPPKTWYEIGAYHDDNEYFRTTGMVHEVCVYSRALGAEEIAARHRAGRHRLAGPLRLAVGPIVEFVGPDAAIVRWHTRQPSPTVLDYGLGAPARRIEDAKPKTEHEARLSALQRNRLYKYRIESRVDGHRRRTPTFELDTFLNYRPAAIPDRPRPYPVPRGGSLAPEIVSRSGMRQGICVFLGCGDGRTAYELARCSHLRVVGVETDATKVAAARRSLTKAGIYGTRVSVRHVASLDRLPFPNCFADLVVPDRGAEARRILRPGGVAFRTGLAENMQAFVGPPLPRTGEWTHQYGRPDNSAYGGESLGGATSAADLEVQWLGRPGPRCQADRNGRKPSPLAANGRLFLQGLRRIVAINAYNGTILWSREIPDFLRLNVPRDCSNWCADREHVYAAVRDKLYRLDAATGKLSRTHDVVPGPKDWEWDWGFVARDGDRIVGSAVKQGSAYTNFWGGGGWYDQKAAPKVCSDNLFALDEASGRVLWQRAGGVVLNSTITIANGRVYFVECRNTEVRGSDARRVAMHELWQSQFLTALDVRTGSKLWEQYVDTIDGATVIYLASGGDALALVSSGSETYQVCAFTSGDGKPLWETRFKWPKGDHGAHMSRPAIVGGRLYVRPRVFDLATGKPAGPAMPGGGCGTYAASDQALIFRAGKVTLWDTTSGKATGFDRLRPDCWLSTIPACGLLLSPEGGGGCSCGSWIETSIAFLPIPRN